MLYLLYLLVFTTMVFIITGVYSVFFSQRANVVQRLKVYTNDEAAYGKDDISLKEAALNLIGFLGSKFQGNNYMDKKKRKLNQAYIRLRVEEFVGISLILALLAFVLLYLLTKLVPLALLGLIFGFVLPDLLVNSIKSKRGEKLNSQLPEALDILSNGLRAGLSFTQAMSVASQELESPIKDEFSKVVRDNSLGMSLEKALQDFSDRTDDEDIDMLIMALIIQRKVGGNLTEILDTIAATIRDRVRIRGEVKTLTAQGKMSAIIISLLPVGVALMIFIVNPSYMMELFQNKIGLILVGLALVMEVVGMYVLFKMTDIEV